ncbi:MAG: DegT/DnrJ/EryC1/StrS family aminotransferase [Candidatus Methanospirare jalkutatii]|nr:DegT/DnrJ/EryC1/StrS family aminotransferase [Candidatus Methanospirare jalkutatii]
MGRKWADEEMKEPYKGSMAMIRISAPFLGEEEISAVERVLRSGRLSQGANVEAFESAFADFIGVEHAIAVSSGTAALHIALLAAGIGEGDEVITTPFTFIATANAILFVGAKPVFVDVREDDFNIDVEKVKDAITERTKAIIPVHLYGQPCDMKAIADIAEDHNLHVIEDACQAHGAEFAGKKVGSFGTAGCFSFYPTKNMTTGEGGMLTTNSKEIAKKARMLRNHGSSARYMHEILGFNMRMTDISAAIGIEQLKKLPYFTKRRRENAEYLTERLKGIRGIVTPVVKERRTHVFNQYTIRVVGDEEADGANGANGDKGNRGKEGVVNRDDLARMLTERGVEVGIYYPTPVHKQPLYRKLGYDCSLDVSERLSAEVLSLPVHPGVGKEDLDYIVDIIKRAMMK